MPSTLPLLFPGIAAGTVLAGLLTWLGLRLLEQRSIVLGLMLAQLAVLGSSLAGLAGHREQTVVRFCWSVAFTLAGVGIDALTRTRITSIPQEALLAIVYVVAASATILMTGESRPRDRSSELLAVSWHTVANTAVLFVALAVLLWIFRRRHLLFAAILAIALPASVATAGVLLSFAYLLAPAMVGLVWSKTPWRQFAIGWTMGAIVTAIGVWLSFRADLPTGPAIVCTFAIALFMMAIVRRIVGTPLA